MKIREVIKLIEVEGWYLVTTKGSHRGIRLLEAYLGKIKQTEGLPLIGRVAAGEPILAEENIERYIDPKELFGQSKNTFILKVIGDSMV